MKSYRLGYCLWLLSGKTLPERIDFLYGLGFRSVAKLQSTGSEKSAEAREAAQVIRERGMTMTCHTNVQANLKDGRMDPDFARRALEDDLWWHEATGGAVRSCCSDLVVRHDPRTVLMEDTIQLAGMQREILGGRGILTGIENSPEEYALPDDFAAMAPHVSAVLWDAGHANIALNRLPQLQGLTMEEYLDAVPLPVAEVHITDNHGERDEHLAPLDGNLDFAALRRGLDKRPETPVVSLEYCKDIGNGLYDHDITIPAERDKVLRATDRLKALFA